MIGSFEVHVGDMDQVLHLWRITGGFEKIDTAARVLGNDKVKKDLQNNQQKNKMSNFLLYVGLPSTRTRTRCFVAFAPFAVHATV